MKGRTHNPYRRARNRCVVPVGSYHDQIIKIGLGGSLTILSPTDVPQ